MGDWRNAALQAAFWTYANSLRVEAKLCDIVLYVQGRKGAMVGYPAHKLLLISASKYFKLLFEREDLRNFCHFPHLSEDGLFTVLDIVYGREIADSVNIDDALMAARFLQVDCAVEELEAKRTALEAKARAPPSPKPKKTVSGIKRRATSPSGNVEGPLSSRERLRNESSSHNESAEMRIFKNFRNQGDDESVSQSFHDSVGSPISHEENSSTGPTDGGGGEEYEQQDNRIKVKSEPNVDLTMEEEMGYSQGEMTDQGYGQMDNMNTESGLGMFGSGVSFETDGAATFGDQAMYEGGTYMMGSDNSMDKKRQCDICGKVFATAKHLEDHRATHTDAVLTQATIIVQSGKRQLFICDVCGERFKFKEDMLSHRDNKCITPSFQCDRCPKKFKGRKKWVAHLKHHDLQPLMMASAAAKARMESNGNAQTSTVTTDMMDQ